MSDSGKLHQQLIQALSEIDRKDLAGILDCSLSEVSKKISGAGSFKLPDLAKALAETDMQIVLDSDYRVIHIDELQALNLLANRYLDRRVNNDA